MTTTNNTAAALATTDVFATSSWGTPGSHADADAFIASAEKAGHWPVDVRTVGVTANDEKGGLVAPGAQAIIGEYADGTRDVLGINGSRYNATSAEQWREIVRAAVAAGAEPIHSHSWDGKVMAQFRIGEASGIMSTLVLGDSFNGACKLVAGTSATRLGCANAMVARMRSETKRGNDWAKISHTASLDEKVNRLVAGIDVALAEGRSVADLFDRAASTHLPAPLAKAAFDVLFPAADEDASQRAKTRAENMRAAARKAAAMPINRVGGRGNLATLWNAATYLVDRTETGEARSTRGDSSRVDSLLFGKRGKRVEEVRHLVEVILADGRVEAMTVGEAVEVGVDAEVLGSKVLEEMLADC